MLLLLRLRHLLSPISLPNHRLLFYHSPPPLCNHSSQQSITLQLFSWGRGASGQLGAGLHQQIRIYPAPVATLSLPLPPNFPTSSPIPPLLSPHIHISCGLFHSGLVVNGNLWIWGKGDGGRLGLGHQNPIFLPTFNPFLETDVRTIALGALHSVALDVHGRIFTWGYGGFGALGHSTYHTHLFPRLVEGSWDGQISRIATSATHTAALTNAGKLYIWGRDEGKGRLGLGPSNGPDHRGGVSTPSEVKALPFPVAAVSCGGLFTMALTEDGQIWNWGANSNYELGRGDKIGGWKPQPIPSMRDVRIVQIASGGCHSLALTEKGEVLSWGEGQHGQLGHSTRDSVKVPERVEALANEQVTYIACGGSSSAAITDKGKLFMWGNARDGQIGVPGVAEVEPSPMEVKFLKEDDGLGETHNVVAVAVGASHAMCLVSRSQSSTLVQENRIEFTTKV